MNIMTQTPLISIIIPIYNAEKVINRCIKSILKQTYRNIEIVCVNDGSKDKSIDLLNSLKIFDNRIVIINEVNQGAFKARINGVLNSNGEYILFCDSDDTLPDNKSIEKLVGYMNENKDIQLIQFSSRSTYKNGLFENSIRKTVGKINIKDFYKNYAYECMGSIPKTAITVAIWDKLYKADILRSVVADSTDISFPIGEDLYLNLLYLDSNKLENILITKDVFYNYYAGTGILSNCNPWKALIGYNQLKKLQIQLCDKWSLDDSVKCMCHTETIYYCFVIVKDEYFCKKTSESDIINSLRNINKYDHIKAAKEYFLNHPEKCYPELKILISSSPEEYMDYVKNNCTKPDSRFKRLYKRVLNKVVRMFIKK